MSCCHEEECDDSDLALPLSMLDWATCIELDIYTACALGYSDYVKYLLPKCDPNAFNSSGWTPLMYCAYIGHIHVAQLLINHLEIIVNRKTYAEGITALMLASRCGNEDIVNLLLRHGALVNERDNNGRTSLSHACTMGCHSMVANLISTGAMIDVCDYISGSTPLIDAAREGHELVVQVLLDKGANVLALNKDGHNAHYMAWCNDHMLVALLLDRFEKAAEVEVNGDVEDQLRSEASLIRSHNVESGVNSNSEDVSERPRRYSRNTVRFANDIVVLEDITRPMSRVLINGKSPDVHGSELSAETKGRRSIVPKNSSPQFSHRKTSDSVTITTPETHGTATMKASVSKSIPTAANLEVFLKRLDLEKYYKPLNDNGITFDSFLKMDNDSLRGAGILLFGPRRKMLAAIHIYNQCHRQSGAPRRSSITKA